MDNKIDVKEVELQPVKQNADKNAKLEEGDKKTNSGDGDGKTVAENKLTTSTEININANENDTQEVKILI